MNPEKLAERKAFADFKEVFPGQKFDKYNRQHVSYIRSQIKAHMDLMERNRLQKRFGSQW